MSAAKPVLISVVICTYNRAALLATCLQSLADQTLDKLFYEVIIVHNSTDDTQEIAESFTEMEPNFRIIIEIKNGLSHARNRGWKEAQGKYVAYTDDDCILPQEWLATARSIIEDRAPDVFGGPIYVWYNSSKPEWFKDEYVSHVIGDVPKILSLKEFLDGNNFFISRDMIAKLHGFDAKLGMIGNQIGYGEETAIQLKIRAYYPETGIFYHPSLVVYHLVRKEKMTIKWILSDNFINGQYYALIFIGSKISGKKKMRSFISNLGGCFLRIISLPVSFFIRDKEKYPYYQNYLYEIGGQILFSLGVLFELTHFQLFQQSSLKRIRKSVSEE